MTTRVTRRSRAALGYYADIPQAFWRRATRYHIPGKWFGCWLGIAIMQFGFGFTHGAIHWQIVLVVGSILAFAELWALQWVSIADPTWDTMLISRDCHYYEAD